MKLDKDKMVIYEMHIQTFSGVGLSFDNATLALPQVAALGVNAVEILPVAAFPGDPRGWGYNPGAPFAPHPALGGYQGLKRFVRAANKLGLAVILDVVYNHMDGDNILNDLDGSAGGSGDGIYFFQGNGLGQTPWGPRPNYGTPQVLSFLVDNLKTFVNEYHVSGFRWDSTICIRLGGDGVPCWNSVDNILPGWLFFQAANTALNALGAGGTVTIAEDTKNYFDITLPTGQQGAGPPGAPGGAGFTRQWGELFYYSYVPNELVIPDNSNAEMAAVAQILVNQDGEDPHRILYTENHDKASNQQAGRIPMIVNPGGSASSPTYWAVKKALMGVSMLMTTSGTPMLLYGQEFLTFLPFTFPVPPTLNWTLATTTNAGFVRAVTDLVKLRLGNGARNTASLSCRGGSILDVTDQGSTKLAAILRRCPSGPGDTIVVVNMGSTSQTYSFGGIPNSGVYQVLFNGDLKIYSPQFGNGGASQTSVTVSNGQVSLTAPAYAMLILAQ